MSGRPERHSYRRRATQVKAKWARRWNAINQLKLAAGCHDCGFDRAAVALDFDHIGEKKFNVSHFNTRSWKAIFEEIQKCEVVCSNCHRVRTLERKLVA
jgi:hypothetical protein